MTTRSEEEVRQAILLLDMGRATELPGHYGVIALKVIQVMEWFLNEGTAFEEFLELYRATRENTPEENRQFMAEYMKKKNQQNEDN